MKKDWEYIGEGRSRRVYRRGNVVIKIPLNNDGIHDNYREAHVWQNRSPSNYAQYARCKIVPHTYVLMMEYARYVVQDKTDDTGYVPMNKCPEWAFSIDCWQVGYNRQGKLVAYDYGFSN